MAQIHDITRVPIDGTVLTTALVTLHTVTTGRVLQFAELAFCNYTTSNCDIEVQFIPTGSTDADRYKRIATGANSILRAGETRLYPFHPMMEAGDFIQVKASDASRVSIHGGLVETNVTT